MLREAACPSQSPAQPGEGAEGLGGLPSTCLAVSPLRFRPCNAVLEFEHGGKGVHTARNTLSFLTEEKLPLVSLSMCVIQKITKVIEIGLVNTSYKCNYLVILR